MSKKFFKLRTRLEEELGETIPDILKSIREKDIIGIQEARYLAIDLGVPLTIPTAIDIVERHKLGHQPAGPGGSWIINRQHWENFLIHGTSQNVKKGKS